MTATDGMMFEHYATTHATETRRVRWVHDGEYQSEGSFAFDSDEDTARAGLEEQRALAAGDCVALGAIVETRCGTCEQWEEKDSLWGIVVAIGEDLEQYGSDNLDIPANPVPDPVLVSLQWALNHVRLPDGVDPEEWAGQFIKATAAAKGASPF